MVVAVSWHRVPGSEAGDWRTTVPKCMLGFRPAELQVIGPHMIPVIGNPATKKGVTTKSRFVHLLAT